MSSLEDDFEKIVQDNDLSSVNDSIILIPIKEIVVCVQNLSEAILYIHTYLEELYDSIAQAGDERPGLTTEAYLHLQELSDTARRFVGSISFSEDDDDDDESDEEDDD